MNKAMDSLKLDLSLVGEKDEAPFLAEIKTDAATMGKIREMGLSIRQVKDNLGKLLDYKQDLSACRDCPGLDKCPKEKPGYVLDVFLSESGFLERTLTPCPHLERLGKITRNFLYRDYPDSFLDAGLDKEEWTAPGRRSLLLALSDEETPLIYLTGESGSGRSYLTAAYLNDCAASNDLQVAYVDCAKRMPELSSLYFKDRPSFDRKLGELCRVPVLCLDNFGSEFVTDVIRDGIYAPIFGARKIGSFKTVVASDFALAELPSVFFYKGPKVKVDRFVGAIRENFKSVDLAKTVASLLHK